MYFSGASAGLVVHTMLAAFGRERDLAALAAIAGCGPGLRCDAGTLVCVPAAILNDACDPTGDDRGDCPVTVMFSSIDPTSRAMSSVTNCCVPISTFAFSYGLNPWTCTRSVSRLC